MKEPFISVIIPAFNADKYIAETLNSVLLQSHSNFEAIVVNDASTDRTKEIVNEFIERDARFKLIEQSHLGTANARNHGIKTSRGELISFLDADDLWHPDKLLEQYLMFRENSSVDFVSCFAVIVDENSCSKGLISGRYLKGNCYRTMLEAGGISGGSIVMVRKECLEQVGEFNPRLGPYEDWDMWVRLARLFKIKTVPKILVGYRRSENSISRNYKKLFDSGELLLKNAFEKDRSLSKKYYNLCFARDIIGIAAWCFIDKQYNESRFFVKKALETDLFACLTDFQRLGFLVLFTLSMILPKKIFEKIFMNNLIPGIFKLRFGETFTELCNRRKSI